MTSPYLNRPLIPLPMALPTMLAKIESELANVGPTDRRHLQDRAELVRELLTPRSKWGCSPSSRADQGRAGLPHRSSLSRERKP